MGCLKQINNHLLQKYWKVHFLTTQNPNSNVYSQHVYFRVVLHRKDLVAMDGDKRSYFNLKTKIEHNADRVGASESKEREANEKEYVL